MFRDLPREWSRDRESAQPAGFRRLAIHERLATQFVGIVRTRTIACGAFLASGTRRIRRRIAQALKAAISGVYWRGCEWRALVDESDSFVTTLPLRSVSATRDSPTGVAVVGCSTTLSFATAPCVRGRSARAADSHWGTCLAGRVYDPRVSTARGAPADGNTW